MREMVYHGIEVAALAKKNIERYGPYHLISDLEDAPDGESRAYFDRWRKSLTEKRDVPLVEQHYGIDTTAIDLTFDLKVALFFATHRFQRDAKSGLCRYEYVGANDGQALVYVFVFVWPSLTRTADLVTSIPIFEHLKPTRPVRQSCTLSHFDAHSINKAVTDIYCRLRIADDFDPTGLAAQEELFPSRKEDLFYDALLDHPFFAEKIARYAWA